MELLLVTSSAAELTVLDGADATTLELADLELLDGAVKNTVVAQKAVIYGDSGAGSSSYNNLGALDYRPRQEVI